MTGRDEGYRVCLPCPGLAGMLGLARRADKLTPGAAAVIDAVRSRKKPSLVLLDEAASDKTKSKLCGVCHAHRVAYVILRAEGLLASASGIDSDLAAVAICDPGIAARIRTEIRPLYPDFPADDAIGKREEKKNGNQGKEDL